MKGDASFLNSNTPTLHKHLFPEDKCEKYMGVRNPSVLQRANFFEKCWQEWEIFQVNAISYDDHILIKNLIKDLNLQPFWDYQKKGNQYRFSDPGAAMMFKLMRRKNNEQ